jgi:thioredoxin 1
MKAATIFTVILILVGVSAFMFTSKQKSSNTDLMQSQNTPITTSDNTKISESEIVTKEDPRYVEYSKAIIDGSGNARRVLFFYANWCPTCRPADASFSQNESKIPQDVTVIRVNYHDTETNQEEKDLATKYGVTYQHTFVQIDESGNTITKWNGGQFDELLRNIK